jgi:hypothetical protein
VSQRPDSSPAELAVPAISARKADHIDLCTDGDVAFKHKTNLLEQVQLVHDALPELAAPAQAVWLPSTPRDGWRPRRPASSGSSALGFAPVRSGACDQPGRGPQA